MIARDEAENTMRPFGEDLEWQVKELGFDFYLVGSREAVRREDRTFECIPQLCIPQLHS